MNRLTKTKLIWLAVALMPLLVAVGCGGELSTPQPEPMEQPTPPKQNALPQDFVEFSHGRPERPSRYLTNEDLFETSTQRVTE